MIQPEQPPALRPRLLLLEDVVPRDIILDFDIPQGTISSSLSSWCEGFVSAAAGLPEMTPSWLHSENDPHTGQSGSPLQGNPSIPEGQDREIDIILCPPGAMQDVFETPDEALGVHLVENPDFDVFEEHHPLSRRFRIAIDWDPDRIARLICEGAVTYTDILISTEAWLGTFTHEMQHVRLFAENSNFNAPAAVQDLTEADGHDMFDFSSGYGIRPLEAFGQIRWAEEMEEARDMMEDHVETLGRRMIPKLHALGFDAGSFLEVSGIMENIRRRAHWIEFP